MRNIDFDWKPLALVPVLALLVLPPIGSPSTWLTLTVAGLAMGMIIFIIASGLTLVFGLMDVLNFGHGVFIALGAFVAATRLPVSFVPCRSAGAGALISIVGGLVGALCAVGGGGGVSIRGRVGGGGRVTSWEPQQKFPPRSLPAADASSGKPQPILRLP